jgi:hypothetical protein
MSVNIHKIYEQCIVGKKIYKYIKILKLPRAIAFYANLRFACTSSGKGKLDQSSMNIINYTIF